ncbi:ATP-dependent DNA helicase [Bacillus cereus group sp. MYBK234-1]|uniref:ATP-dependent DNA helicase n=1 Tax=unclassified Bacillus cereus group TaxID=2750818 RepID=UPI003F7A2AB7
MKTQLAITDPIFKEMLRDEPERALERLELEFETIEISELSKIIASLEKYDIIYQMDLTVYHQIYYRIAMYKKEKQDMMSFRHHMIKTAKTKAELSEYINQYDVFNAKKVKQLKKAVELETKGLYEEAITAYKQLKYIPGVLWLNSTIQEIAKHATSISDLKIALMFDIQHVKKDEILLHLKQLEKKLIAQFEITEFYSLLVRVKKAGLLPKRYSEYPYSDLSLLFSAEDLFKKQEYYPAYFELKQLSKRMFHQGILTKLFDVVSKHIILPKAVFKELFRSKGYILRKNQIFMSQSIQEALYTNNTIMIEAAVGIGKSYGYLVPALLKRHASREKKAIIISTSSLVLQDQLIDKDIPNMNTVFQELYGYEPVHAIMGKGKTNFGCSQRIRKYIEQVRKEIKPAKRKNQPFTQLVKIKNYLMDFLTRSPFLDKNDVDSKIITPEIWREINADKCVCKNKCKYVFYRETLGTHNGIIVCNHQQLLAHIRNENAVVPKNIFPALDQVDSIIIDEAHKLEDAAKTIFTSSFTLRSLKEFYNHIQQFYKDKRHVIPMSHDEVVSRYFKKLHHTNLLFKEQIDILENKILSWVIPASFEEQDSKNELLLERDGGRYKLHLDSSNKHLHKMSKQLQVIQGLMENINYHEEDVPYRLRLQVSNFIDVIQRFNQHDGYISFVEKSNGEGWIFSNMRKSYSSILNQQLMSLPQPVILVSGTLRVHNSFTYMKKQLGYTKQFSQPYYLNNTFDYKRNRLAYIPKHLPSPSHRDDEYYLKITTEIIRLLHLTQGRSLILFTNFKDLEEVYSRLKFSVPYKLLKQTKHNDTEKLIHEFKLNKNACLLASGAFFEGFDVPGESLENVIVVKLPYPVLDPVLEEEIKQAGKDRMKNVLLPKMNILLNQAMGRLIRKETDKGLVSILDSRLHRQGYPATKLIVSSVKPSKIYTQYEELETEWQLLR